jgi:hypothetical protein
VAATLIQSEFTYRSGIPSQAYMFVVVVDEQGNTSVRDIQSPFGTILDPWTRIPQSVTDDICAATVAVESLLATTSPINGQLVFAAETSKSFTFSTPLASTTYRVQLESDTFVPLRVVGKTTTGFTVEAGAAFTGTVGFDVFI